jgi:hypothetical protein
MRKSVIFVLLIVTQIPFLVSAQSFYAIRRERNLIINAGTGTAHYFGELANPKQLNKVRMNINVGAEYFLTDRISARADATWFQLSGSDELATVESNRRPRNLSFFSNNVEIDLLGSIQLFPNQKKFYQRKAFNLYGFAGIGVLHFNPKTRYQGEVIALQPLQTEGVNYSRVQFVVPIGLGAKVKVNPWMNIAVEGTYRETFTDYLDDISLRQYSDPATLSSPLSVALSDRRKEFNTNADIAAMPDIRGNPKNEDSYFILTVKAQFYIPTNFGTNKRLYSAKRKSYRKKGGMFKTRKSSLKRSNAAYKKKRR